MEKHQELFPGSSTSSAASSSGILGAHTCNIHGKKEDVLRTRRKMRSDKKEGNQKIKRHRYAFQTRSQIDVLDDGYQWRKYGKKTVKSNKFPRSYYRCTYRGCNVKKQIQRHSKDEHIVITAYEGTHIHPVQKPDESFQQILENMQIYNPPCNISPSLQD